MFVQLKRIQEVDATPDQAIASYGSFVSYMNKTALKIKFRGRRGWSPDRISYSKGINTVSLFHKAINDKFGIDVMFKAINTHKFD